MDLMQYLQDKYPEMKPVQSPPSMSTINGIGTMAYGSRDFDEESGTYVKTLCFTVLFVPLFTLSAYRVADAAQGWYFLGKVPLSVAARAWNWFVLASIVIGVSFGFYHHYLNNPDTIAANRLAQGEQWAAEGKLGQAARLYQEMGVQQGPRAGEARAKLGGLLEGGVDQAGADEVVEVFKAAVDVYKLHQEPADVFAKGLAQARKRLPTAPADVQRLLTVVAPLAPQSPELLELQQPLLEKQLAQNPNDLDAVSALAQLYEARKELARAEQLLTPHQTKLGTREGARILGQIFVGQDKFDLALPLLEGYTAERLQRLQETEQERDNTIKRIDDQVFAGLRKGSAPGFDFGAYKRADKAAQDAMVQNYIDNELRNHPDFKRAMHAIREQAGVVPVALDLGIVQLRRGQAQNDPEARTRELEKAEKTFLAIRNMAGKNDEFRIFLGQVYSWMGKHAEGRKLFDEYLADKGRNTEALVLVSRMLREIGSVADARVLVEEAYQAATDPRKQFAAAGSRAAMAKDLDDRIDWLSKCDPQDRLTKAELCSARGSKALNENRDNEAGQLLREAIEHYSALPESDTTLNNSALAHAALFRLTGDRQQLDLSFTKLEKAAALSPGDSILLRNVADALLSSSMADVIGKAIDLKTLRQSGSLDAVGYLCRDQASEDGWVDKLRRHEGFAKTRSHFERVLTLSPKNAQLYSKLASLHQVVRDQQALAGLVKRAKEANLDRAELIRQDKELLDEKNDDKHRQNFKNAADFHEKIVGDARKLGGPTLAMALGELYRSRVAQDFFEPGRFIEDIVKLAEEAHQAAPSRTTEANLANAYLMRADSQLKQADPAYAALAAKCRRTLGAPILIAMILTTDQPSKKVCLAHADVRKAQSMIVKAFETNSHRADDWPWAMLHSSDPQAAQKLADAVRKNETLPLQRELAQIVTPLSGVEACRAYWAHLMRGENTQAHSVLKRYADEGVPLPMPQK